MVKLIQEDIPEIKVYQMPELLQHYCRENYKETNALYTMLTNGFDFRCPSWILDKYLLDKGYEIGSKVIIYFSKK